jgi:hypothetical protein
MLFYPAALPLSAQTHTYVAGVIRRHRKKTRGLRDRQSRVRWGSREFAAQVRRATRTMLNAAECR